MGNCKCKTKKQWEEEFNDLPPNLDQSQPLPVPHVLNTRHSIRRRNFESNDNIVRNVREYGSVSVISEHSQSVHVDISRIDRSEEIKIEGPELICPVCHQNIEQENCTGSQEILTAVMAHLAQNCQGRQHQRVSPRQIQPDISEIGWVKDLDSRGNLVWKQIPRAPIDISYVKHLPKEEIKSRPFEEKKVWFQYKCDKRRVSYVTDSITLVINRDNVLQESLEQFRTTDGFDLHKEIKIFYVGEEGHDAGGVLREWLTDLTRAMFSQEAHLFRQVKYGDELQYYFDPISRNAYGEDALAMYRFAGQVLAKSLFDKVPVNVCLSKFIVRKLLHQPSPENVVEELKYYDQAIYNSVKYLNESPDIDWDTEEFYFVVMDENGQEIELIPDGKTIRVTAKTRKQYTRKMAKHYLVKSVINEFKEFLKGFLKVIPPHLIQIFDEDELQLLMVGPSEIAVRDWQTHTEYSGNFNAKHNVVKWFWQYIHKLPQEKMRKFLLFSTGMPRIPVDGFRGLQSNRNQPCKYQLRSISYNGPNTLIQAHTCFNRVEIPEYKTKKELDHNMDIILAQEKYTFDFE